MLMLFCLKKKSAGTHTLTKFIHKWAWLNVCVIVSAHLGIMTAC